MSEGGLGPGRLLLFWSIALGGLTFDLATKSMVFARIGPPPLSSVPVIPRILELHTSQNTGALWGLGQHTLQQPDLRGALGRRGDHHLLLALLPGRGLEPAY